MDKPNILLVEDNKLAQIITVELFKQHNCIIDIATNGADALKKVYANQYDFILLDIGLPDMDGFAVAQSIRESANHNQNIPIIAITAHNSSYYKDKAFDSGMNEYMMKPLDIKSTRSLLTKFGYDPVCQ